MSDSAQAATAPASSLAVQGTPGASHKATTSCLIARTQGFHVSGPINKQAITRLPAALRLSRQRELAAVST